MMLALEQLALEQLAAGAVFEHDAPGVPIPAATESPDDVVGLLVERTPQPFLKFGDRDDASAAPST